MRTSQRGTEWLAGKRPSQDGIEALSILASHAQSPDKWKKQYFFFSEILPIPAGHSQPSG